MNSGVEGYISGGFYGDKAAEMAGRYSYNKTPGNKGSLSENAFGVFGGKKQYPSVQTENKPPERAVCFQFGQEGFSDDPCGCRRLFTV